MVPCHSCHIYGTWTSRSKKVWGMLKCYPLGGDEDGIHKRGTFYKKKASSHYVILLYCKTLLQVLLGIYCKRFYQIPFHYITVVFCVWGWQGQKNNSKCPIDINTEWAIPEKLLGFLLYPWKFQAKQDFTLDFPHNCVTPCRNFKS